MKYFKRVTAGVVARIDEAVREIENHEALIQNALEELRKQTAIANVQLAGLQRDGQAMRRRIEQSRAEQVRWRERALQVRAQDEVKAMECLRRSKRAESLVEQLEMREQEHQAAEEKLSAEVRLLGERHRELDERLRMMRARATCAEAGALAHGLEGNTQAEIEDTFERWERKVAVTEFRAVQPSVRDALAHEFDAAEEEAALRLELEALGEAPPVDLAISNMDEEQ